jgi:PiT family inorganic phosphate transporter
VPHFWATMQFGTVPYLSLPVVVLLLGVLALAFDFTNGIHDAANSIATVVSTRVLSPPVAVAWAAFFNFVAFGVFHLRVARTMGTGLIDPSIVDNSVIAATLLSAILWNLFTWYLGLPTSSSHALTFSLIGAGFVKGGWRVLEWDGIGKVAAFVVLSPVIGGLLGALIAVIVMWLFHRASPRRVEKFFRRGQLVSAAFYSLGHGGNDAQKTMGVIFVLLIARGARPLKHPPMCRPRWCWPATWRWAWGRCSAAGESSKRWARRSFICARWTGSAQRPAPR